MKKVYIRKFEDLGDKNWYAKGTDCDSQATFEGSFNLIRSEKRDRFDELFHLGNNGGSYSADFNSKKLDEIIDFLKDDFEIVFVKEEGMFHNKVEITRDEYLNYMMKDTTDPFNEYLFG